MSNMVIESPETKTIVDDYDFLFASGVMMPVTINKEAGDSVTFSPESIVINLSAKPSNLDSTKLIPAEDITIYTKNLASIRHATREHLGLTPEQQVEWNKTLQEMVGVQ